MSAQSIIEDSGVPVPCAVAKKPMVKAKKPRRPLSVADRLMGVKEDVEDEEVAKSIIPDDAEDQEPEAEIQKRENPEVKQDISKAGKLGLISTSVALVAPDATPDTLKPLSIASVPAPEKAPVAVEKPAAAPSYRIPGIGANADANDPAVQAILGKATLPGVPAPSELESMDLSGAANILAESAAAAKAAASMTAGTGMPEHVQSKINPDSYRRFVKIA